MDEGLKTEVSGSSLGCDVEGEIAASAYGLLAMTWGAWDRLGRTILGGLAKLAMGGYYWSNVGEIAQG